MHQMLQSQYTMVHFTQNKKQNLPQLSGYEIHVLEFDKNIYGKFSIESPNKFFLNES